MKTLVQSIIFPLGLLPLLFVGGCLDKGEDLSNLPTLLTLLEEEAQFSTYREAILDFGINDGLDGGLNLTLFPPTNDAFETYLADKGYASLADIPEDTLLGLVGYHFQYGSAAVGEINSSFYSTPATLGPGMTPLSILITSDGSNAFLNEEAQTIMPDIRGRNGYLHGVDKVLDLPKTGDFINRLDDLSVFVQALEMTGLDSLLQSSTPHTFLVPTNEAFRIYFEGIPAVNGLGDLSEARRQAIVRYHIAQGNSTVDRLETGGFSSLNGGEEVIITLLTSTVAFNNSATSVLLDIQATNGVVHVIDRMLEPL